MDYCLRWEFIGADNIPVEVDTPNRIIISSVRVKNFRSVLKKKGEDVEVFQVLGVNDKKKLDRGPEENPRLSELLANYSCIFREIFPPGFPPILPVDNVIIEDKKENSPHRGLYQISPTELVATREYIVGLLKGGRIRPSKSPYRESLFFVRHK